MAFLFLVMWIILSTTNGAYTTISGTWYDDFTGWTVLDDPVIEDTNTYKYHGPFSGNAYTTDKEQFSMTQSFYCAEVSSVNVYYYIFFCGTENTDSVALYLNYKEESYTTTRTLGKPAASSSTKSVYDDKFPDCTEYSNQYYYYPMGPFSIPRVALNNLFTVQFDITVNHNSDNVMFRNIAIECVPITHSPTSPTTPAPTTSAPTTPAPTTPAPTTPAPTTLTASPTYSPTHSPTDSPTHYPTQSPTKNPSNSPTKHPINDPTVSPSNNPSNSPTDFPSNNPSQSPSKYPSNEPTKYPTLFPSTSPTYSPTLPTNMPSISPTHPPSAQPTAEPSTTPTLQPTVTKPKGVDAGSGDVSGEIIVIVSILVGLCCVAIVVGFYCAKYRGVNSKKNKLDNNGFDSNHYVQLIDNGPQTIFGTAVKSVSLGNTTGGGPAFNGNTNGASYENGGRYLVDDESSTDMEDVQENGSDDDVINEMITPQDPLNDDADSHESDNDVVDDMITPQ